MSRKIDTTKPLSKEDREYMLSRGREAEVARIDAANPATPDDGGGDEDDYAKWTVSELKTEADNRELDVPAGAHKADLVKLLEDDDAVNA